MDGLMMDFPLTLTHLMRRAERSSARRDRHALPDKCFHRTSYGETMRRARQLAVALQKARPRARRPRRDAVLEPPPAPRGVLRRPVRRLVLHTLNLRLHPNELAYIATTPGTAP